MALKKADPSGLVKAFAVFALRLLRDRLSRFTPAQPRHGELFVFSPFLPSLSDFKTHI